MHNAFSLKKNIITDLKVFIYIFLIPVFHGTELSGQKLGDILDSLNLKLIKSNSINW